MTKPTKEQLVLLYPNVDADYLSDHIDRKVLLIDMEDEVISKMDVIFNDFKNQLFGLISMPSGYDRTNLINAKLSDLEFQVSNLEVESAIQLHETSGYLYEWLLDKYFGPEASEEYGGEQTVGAVTRKKLLKQDIKNILEQTVSRGQNVSTSIGGSFISLSEDIDVLTKSGNPVSYSDVSKAFDKLGKAIKDSTHSMLQQSVYDAESNTNVYVSDDYEIVYYRVEVLDADICMPCMQIDGSTNEIPLGLMHKNCRGIDVILLRDLVTGKYYDTSHNGYGHKLKTKSFEQKFESLSAKQKKQMLGKSNYDLYSSGQLKPSDFLSNNRQITNKEAKIKVDLKSLKKDINTPQKATNVANYIDDMFKKEVAKMDSNELLAYEKSLGIQKQLYENVPKSAYTKAKPKQSYIDNIDAKYDELNIIKENKMKGVK